MAINATSESNGGNFTPVPSGTHVARCYQMIELGTITEPYLGEMKTSKKVRIGWELPLETKEFKQGEGQKPYVISKDFTLSMHEKATLRKFLESWRGKAFTEEEAKKFDITKLLSAPCMMSVVEEVKEGKSYSKISNVSTMPKGMVCPDQVNETFVLSYDAFDFDKFNTLPKFIKEKMEKSVEFKKISDVVQSNEHTKKLASMNDNDDLPF
jgi:hypothetical protein